MRYSQTPYAPTAGGRRAAGGIGTRETCRRRKRDKRKQSGGYCGGVPPLPIPNREVKPTCADGTAMQCGRVGSRPLSWSEPRSVIWPGLPAFTGHPRRPPSPSRNGGPGYGYLALLRPPYFWPLACLCLPLHATLPCGDRTAGLFDLLIPYYIILFRERCHFFCGQTSWQVL